MWMGCGRSLLWEGVVIRELNAEPCIDLLPIPLLVPVLWRRPRQTQWGDWRQRGAPHHQEEGRLNPPVPGAPRADCGDSRRYRTIALGRNPQWPITVTTTINKLMIRLRPICTVMFSNRPLHSADFLTWGKVLVIHKVDTDTNLAQQSWMMMIVNCFLCRPKLH